VFWTLLRKELAYQVLSGRLLIALALLAILIPLSSILLLRQQEQLLEEIKPYEEGQRRFMQRLGEQVDPNQRFDAYASGGVTVARRPPTLSFVAQGLERVMPRMLRARAKAAQWQVTSLETDKPTNVELENPLLERFPVVDTVYLVAVLGALLAVFVSFDAVCGERERGTLRLLFANPVRRGTVILAKWSATFVSVGTGLVLATFVVLLYTLVTGTVSIAGETLWRWGLITLLGLVYVGFFSALGVLISSLVSTRRVALLVGLAVWLALVLVAPGTAAVTARSVVPLPERPRVQVLWKEYSDGIRGRRDVAVMSDMRDLVPEDEEKLRLVEVHERKAEEQRRFFAALSRLTPAASYIYASTELAGTGASYYNAFRRADQRLADEFRTFIVKHRPDARAKKLAAEAVDVARLPSFDEVALSGGDALAMAGWDLAALLCETLAVLVLAVFLFVRVAEL